VDPGNPWGPESKMLYKDLRILLANELVNDESEETLTLMSELAAARKRGYLTRSEFLAICRWKSPRAIRLCEQNSRSQIRRLSTLAFTSRSERVRLEALTSLHGVSVPMASAVLTLTNPQRYGVIDIRVWQLLFDLKSVRQKPQGVGFNFKNWYHYLIKFRYHARELNVSARCVERTLFRYHRKIQQGVLYRRRTT
jgi:hypothetical protein